MQTAATYFDNPAINREYLRWRKKIGAQIETPENALSADEVLRAHFYIAEFFDDEQSGLGGLGPRDRGGDLLHSAISRQFTGYGGVKKWEDDFDVAASLLFGLVKNHPFHDGNKRTALLAVLHLLAKHGRTASARKKKFEDMVVSIVDNRHRKNDLYRYLREQKQSADDADVAYISYKLKEMTRSIDRSRRALTYRAMNRLLKERGFEMKNPHDNTIGIIRTEDKQRIGQIGFPGMSKQVAKSVEKKIRDMCELRETDGYDSRAFYNGADDMMFLLAEYATPLRNLAHR